MPNPADPKAIDISPEAVGAARRCENCEFWRRGFREIDGEKNFIVTDWPVGSNEPSPWGDCLCRAPSAVASDEVSWARSYRDDWCGEFRPRKEANNA